MIVRNLWLIWCEGDITCQAVKLTWSIRPPCLYHNLNLEPKGFYTQVLILIGSSRKD
jgi:hypothetical protein